MRIENLQNENRKFAKVLETSMYLNMYRMPVYHR